MSTLLLILIIFLDAYINLIFFSTNYHLPCIQSGIQLLVPLRQCLEFSMTNHNGWGPNPLCLVFLADWVHLHYYKIFLMDLYSKINIIQANIVFKSLPTPRIFDAYVITQHFTWIRWSEFVSSSNSKSISMLIG